MPHMSPKSPYGDHTTMLPYSNKYIILLFSITTIFSLILSSAESASAGYGSSNQGHQSPGLADDDIYNYYFNDHSSSNNNDNSGYTTDPYRHNDEYAIDLTDEWAKIGSRIRKPKCVDIPANMTLCQGIGYTSMMLPNILEHDSLAEVTAQARSWVPLININCHPDAKVFLCSLFSPVCLDRLIYPCRSLCEAVHTTCGRRMKAHGFDWPEMLECHKFPADDDMCIPVIHKVIADNNCTACRHPLTYESLIDHFCRADIVMKATLKSFNDVLGNRELVLRKKKKIYKSANGVKKSEARRLTPVIQGGASCVCETINKTQERYLLMGYKRGDKLMIIFGIPWRKKNKEFRKGLKAIKKSNTCEGIFTELSQNGIEKRGGLNAGDKKVTGKKGKKGKGKRNKKKGRKGKKGKKGKRGKGKNGKGRKGRKGKNKRKNRKNRNKKGGRNNDTTTNAMGSKSPEDIQREKWAREDRALDNFMKAAN